MSDRRFNQTAYRILMLMLWLIEQPLTMEQINDRFNQQHKINRVVSQDTLWLYINTLKELGCTISRPTRTNGFRYILTYHPFTYTLSPQDIALLKDAYASLEDTSDYWHVIYFQNTLKRIFGQAANSNRQSLYLEFMADLRSFQPSDLAERIDILERHCLNRQIIEIAYDSPKKGDTRIMFLPQKIFYYQNQLYLLGHTQDQKKASMLRLDRMGAVRPVHNPMLKNELIEKQNQLQSIVIRILNCPTDQFIGLAQDETVEIDTHCNNHLQITLKTDNEFLLKQKLLSSGHQFQIMSPHYLRQELNETLQEMQALYV